MEAPIIYVLNGPNLNLLGVREPEIYGRATLAAAFFYAAYAILDTLKMLACPVIEVHISNIHRREAKWRAKSIMSQAATGIISGLGMVGYALAVAHLARSLVREAT